MKMRSTKMLTLALAVAATSAFLPALKAQNNQPKRVRAKMDGFELAPTGKSATQIGGASRGIGGTTLYAPKVGKAYSLTPTFSWSPSADAGEVVFMISPVVPGSQPLYKTTLTADHFTYPADAPPLQPGMTYVWSVQPSLDLMGSAATARVTIVGGDERAALDAALAAAPGPDAQAKVFTNKRVWYDAVKSYCDLVNMHPNQAEYRQDRADLYDQLPQTRRLADADMDKAPH